MNSAERWDEKQIASLSFPAGVHWEFSRKTFHDAIGIDLVYAIHQVQPLCGCCFTGLCSTLRVKNASHVFRRPVPAPYVNQRPDHGPHHVVQKPIGGEVDAQKGGWLRVEGRGYRCLMIFQLPSVACRLPNFPSVGSPDIDFKQRANTGRFVWPIGFKTPKIMSADEFVRCDLHRPVIQPCPMPADVFG